MAPKSEGTPIGVRLPDDILTVIDERRQKTGLSRAETIRRMLRFAVQQQGKR